MGAGEGGCRLNAKGGIKLADGKMHKIVLKFVDDKSSDTEAAAAMEKLIKSDGLKIILSSNTTPYNQAAATVAEQYGAYLPDQHELDRLSLPRRELPELHRRHEPEVVRRHLRGGHPGRQRVHRRSKALPAADQYPRTGP